jgi:hypothetical protein
MPRRASFTTLTILVLLSGACSGAERSPTSPLPAAAATALLATSAESSAGVYIDLQGACGMFDAAGNVVFPLDAHVNVITESRNGVAVHNCFTQVQNATGQAIRYDAFNNPVGAVIPCTIINPEGAPIATLTFHEQISASGRAHLICVARAAR